jgi:energy-coupling factor transporter ATP-binding protein EcfA2
MPNVFIVMGDAQSGKSTTIRALTGLGPPKKCWNIRKQNNEDIDIYVFSHALQEDDKTKTVNQLLALAKGCNKNILVSLRIGRRNTARGTGYDHIRQFIEQGCNIAQIVVLIVPDENNTRSDGNIINGIEQEFHNEGIDVNPLVIVRRANELYPANAIAAKIRKEWGWL